MVAGGVAAAAAGALYFLTSDTESLCQDVRDLKLLGGLKREMSEIAVRKHFSAVELFEKCAAAYPNRVSMVNVDESGAATPFSWREMDIYSNQVANWGLGLGLLPGDNVALVMDNRPEYVAIWAGMAKIGVRTALINTNLVGKNLEHCLKIADARAYIIGREHVAKCVELMDRLPGSNWFSSVTFKSMVTYPYQTDGSSLPAGFQELDEVVLSRNQSQPPRPGVSPVAPLLYIYTSGTTGLPKAAAVTSVRYTSAAKAFHMAFNITEEDRIYCCLPLYHSAAGMLGVGMSWASGATMVVRRKFSTRNYWRDCALYDCTVVQYIGELCRYLTLSPESPHDRQHRVRLAVGNGLRPDVWGKFVERFGVETIGEFYGATEGNTALVNLRNRYGSIGNLPRAVSKLGLAPFYLFQFDVEEEKVVRDKSGRCIRCGPNEVGEMLARIDTQKDPLSRFDGYRNKAATDKKIVRDVEKEGDQWFRTGDLLYYDKYGNYYFVDRIGDTFRWKGENVSTNEVAEVLNGFDGVQEANVYGVTIPHHDGRACMAALVVNPNFDATAFYKYNSENLPAYSRPVFLRLSTEMQITGTFKHQKVAWRKEGFDPSKVKDKLMMADNNAKTYVPVDDVLYNNIINDKLKAKL